MRQVTNEDQLLKVIADARMVGYRIEEVFVTHGHFEWLCEDIGSRAVFPERGVLLVPTPKGTVRVVACP